MPLIRMPDGALANVPDNPSPELLQQIEAAMAPQQATAPAPAPDIGFLHKAKLFGSDLLKGLLSGPAAYGDQEAAVIQGMYGAPKEFKVGDELSKKLESVGPQPQTEAEKWQSAATRGAGGALLQPGSMARPAITALAGAGAGAGSEAGGRLSDNNPLARLIGGLLGGVGAGAAGVKASSVAKPQVSEVAKSGLSGIPEELLKKAQDFQARSVAQNIPVDFVQALEAVGATPSALNVIRDRVAQSTSGHGLQKMLNDQPTQLEMQSDMFVGKMPGRNYGEAQAANNLAEAAGKRIAQARGERTQAVQADYQSAGKLSPQFRTEFLNSLAEKLQQPGLTPEAADAIREAIASTRKVPRSGAPAVEANDFDTIIQSLQGKFRGMQRTPANPRTDAQVTQVADELRVMLRQASPGTAKAAETYARISKDVVDPLKQGPVGEMLGTGYRPDRQASIAKMQAVFSRGVDPKASNSPIRTLGREVSKADPEAFQDAAKTYYSGKVSQAFDPRIGGSPATNADAAARLWDGLFKDAKQYQAMKDTVSVVAETSGQSAREAVRGLEAYAQMVKALKNRPPGMSGVSSAEVSEMAGQSKTANALRAFGMIPFSHAAKSVSDAVRRDSFRQLDQLLTTPEGAAKLIELSKQPVMSNKAVVLFASLGGTDVNPVANMPE